MKAFSIITNAIYAIAIVAILLFLVGGFIPEDLNKSPLDVDIGTESEYSTSDPIEILELNIGSAVNSYGNTVTAYGKNTDDILTRITIIDPNDNVSVTTAVAEIKIHYSSHAEDNKVVLKGIDGKILTQRMIMKESDEITTRMYTEISVTNNLRYDLLEVNIGVDQLNNEGTVKYRIVSSEPITIAVGETASLPIDIKINTLNSALIMLIGAKDTIDINLGFDISGKYFYGLAGAEIYANAKFSTLTTNPIDNVKITDNKIEVESNKKIELIPIENVSASIGLIEIDIKNDSTGFSIVIDSGTTKTIIEALESQYVSEDYTIVVDIGDGLETITFEPKEYAQMIDIVKQLMAEVGL